MKKFNPQQWKESFKWEFVAYPFFTSAYNKASMPPHRKYFTCWDDFLSFFCDGQLIAFKPKREILSVGRGIIKEMLAGKGGYLKTLEEVHDGVNRAMAICLKMRDTNNYSSLNGQWSVIQSIWSKTTVIFSFDYPFDEFLMKLRDDNPADYQLLNKYLAVGAPSFIDKANNKLIKLNKKYPENLNEVHKIFLKQFGWLQNSYQGRHIIDKKWLRKHLLQIKSQKKSKPMSDSQKKLPKKYSLLVKTAKLGIGFRDDRKKLLLIIVEITEKWLREICKTNNWKFEIMRWLTMDEILEILKNPKSKYLAKAEKYYLKKERFGTMIPSGYEDVGKSFWQEVLSAQISDCQIKEIKGITANKGICEGVVKIIRDPKKEAKKFNQGDILVTSMTRPEFMPLMAKASAFVTNEGGITSHAALIAREINKPCVIATKIATEVLKDGDLVEVDADKGVVKIVNSKNNKIK